MSLAERMSNSNYRDLLYAILLLLPTFAFVPVQMYLVFAFTVLYFERERLFDLWRRFKGAPFVGRNKLVWLVGVIVLAALLNKMVNGHDIYSLRDYYAPFYLFPLLIITSILCYSQGLLRFLVIITAVECAVGLMEYGTGIRSFLLDLGDRTLIDNYELLYDSRVYGLSVNSSILGLKVFAAFLLIDYVRFNAFWEWVLRVLLLVGLLISFSRTPILVLIAYWGLTGLIGVFRQKTRTVKVPALQFKLMVLLAVFVFNSSLKYQLTRGESSAESAYTTSANASKPKIPKNTNTIPIKPGQVEPEKQRMGDRLMMQAEGVQSSGRKLIWINYINFIEANLWFGNGSDKLMLRSYQPGTNSYKEVHAHNSYLQLLASHGLIIFLLFVLFYLMYSKWINLIVVGSILLFCMANYSIFYGFSYMDVVLLIFLVNPLKLNYDNEGEG